MLCIIFSPIFDLFVSKTFRYSRSAHKLSNQAILDGGLLPYRLCGAEIADGGAGFRVFEFTLEEIGYKLAISAASLYGFDSDSPRVEYLIYYTDAGKPCRRTSGCALPRIISPLIFCTFMSGKRRGSIVIPTGSFPTYVAILQCPLIQSDGAFIRETPQIQVQVDIEGSRANCSLCLQFIHVIHDAVICTEPFFGYSSQSSFWLGDPRFQTGHDLLTSFITHHLDVVNIGHITINAFQFVFKDLTAPFIGTRVAFRSGWTMEILNVTNVEAMDFEAFAEATCLWEHRLDALWVFNVHAADNFLLSSVPGETVPDALKRIDSSFVSGFELPIVVPSTNHSTSHDHMWAQQNVLQRWSLNPLCPNDYGQNRTRFCDAWRTIPVANPRHLSHFNVHENEGRLSPFLFNLEGNSAHEATRLFVLHIMGLSRSHYDSGRGDHDAAVDKAGELLARALSRITSKSITRTFIS